MKKNGYLQASTKPTRYVQCTGTPNNVCLLEVVEKLHNRKGILQEREKALHHDAGENNSRHNPVAGILTNFKSYRGALVDVGAAGSSCTVGQRTVNDQVSSAINIRNGD